MHRSSLALEFGPSLPDTSWASLKAAFISLHVNQGPYLSTEPLGSGASIFIWGGPIQSYTSGKHASKLWSDSLSIKGFSGRKIVAALLGSDAAMNVGIFFLLIASQKIACLEPKFRCAALQERVCLIE